MRIDLSTGGTRPQPVRLALRALGAYVGADPGPPVAMTYRPDLVHPHLTSYLKQALTLAKWDHGRVEMFSAFVSKLNSCSF